MDIDAPKPRADYAKLTFVNLTAIKSIIINSFLLFEFIDIANTSNANLYPHCLKPSFHVMKGDFTEERDVWKSSAVRCYDAVDNLRHAAFRNGKGTRAINARYLLICLLNKRGF